MSTIRAIRMPKWGMEMSEGDVSAWHVDIGDPVDAGDDLLDVETSKIVNTVTASHSGVLRAIIAKPGDTLAVGALLGVIADAEAAEADIEAFVVSQQTSGVAEEMVAADTGEGSAPPAPVPPPGEAERADPALATAPANEDATTATAPAPETGPDDSAVAASPVARRLAKEYRLNLNNVRGTGRHGRVSKRDLENAVTAAGGKLLSFGGASVPAAAVDDSAVRSTPVARRLAKQLDVNLLECRASGDRGRVCKADVEAAAALRNRGTGGSTAPAVESDPWEARAMSGMRRTIASRLQSSKQTAPHFRVHVDAEIDALLAVRKQINAANTDARVSVNDFLIKACASALMAVPELNVQFDGDELKFFRRADIAVAVAIDEGLITPIVTAADSKGLVVISNEMRDLATRAKLGNLKPAEFQGGSFCISNLGMFGIRQFDAIINPPQGAILAVGSGEQRPVVKGGELTVATVVSLTLSSDHRIIDGATAARFMSTLKGYLEQPATMLG